MARPRRAALFANAFTHAYVFSFVRARSDRRGEISLSLNGARAHANANARSYVRAAGGGGSAKVRGFAGLEPGGTLRGAACRGAES